MVECNSEGGAILLLMVVCGVMPTAALAGALTATRSVVTCHFRDAGSCRIQIIAERVAANP
jgi:hypothetical protein